MKNIKIYSTKRKAFTLIELLIVIAIIGILFIVLVSKVDFATDKAKATGVQTDFRSFQLAFDTVAKENAGFNTFGWDTGDLNANGKRDSYDEGDTNKDDIQNGTEVFTGHKVYAETFTKVYSLVKPGTTGYDRDALNRLETAINANLDPKLHITIGTDGKITMANGAQDPWNKEYHGYYITNAEVDGLDRGAIVMYSDGANNEFGSEHKITNGVVSVSIPGNNKFGKDDYALVSIYTYLNGYGEVKNLTVGFSNNQTLGANSVLNPNPGEVTPDTPDTPDVPDEPDEPEVIIAPGLYTSGQNYADDALITPWDTLVANGDITVTNGVVKCINKNLAGDLKMPANGITSIADNGFYECYFLTDIVFSPTLTSIGNSAFRYCRSFTQFDIPEGVTTIGNMAFANCQSLLNIHFPESLISFGYGVCSTSTKLETINIPNQITEIPMNAFDLTKITTLILGENVQTIGQQAFNACTELVSIDCSKSKLTSIGSEAFLSCSSLTDITLSNNITTIYSDAFKRCTSLKSFNMPNSITQMGINIFEDCTSLESFTFNSTYNTVTQGMFKGCTALKEITLPNNITKITAYAFSGCTSLETVNMSNRITMIMTEAFKNCTSLTNINLPNSVETIWDKAFENCTSLTSITIQEHPYYSVSLKQNAFKGCTNLTSVSLPKNIKVENYCFENCTNLAGITYAGTTSTWLTLGHGEFWFTNSGINKVQCSNATLIVR